MFTRKTLSFAPQRGRQQPRFEGNKVLFIQVLYLANITILTLQEKNLVLQDTAAFSIVSKLSEKRFYFSAFTLESFLNYLFRIFRAYARLPRLFYDVYSRDALEWCGDQAHIKGVFEAEFLWGL